MRLRPEAGPATESVLTQSFLVSGLVPDVSSLSAG